MNETAAPQSTLQAGLSGAWSRRCAAALIVLTLTACASQADRPTAAQSGEQQLFTETNENILEYHIKEVQPQQLALTGLARLSSIDPNVSIESAAGSVTLNVAGQIRHYDAPGPSELVDWSVLTSNILDDARTLSPVIGAKSLDKLEELMIDGTLAKSRSLFPLCAAQSRA